MTQRRMRIRNHTCNHSIVRRPILVGRDGAKLLDELVHPLAVQRIQPSRVVGRDRQLVWSWLPKVLVLRLRLLLLHLGGTDGRDLASQRHRMRG